MSSAFPSIHWFFLVTGIVQNLLAVGTFAAKAIELESTHYRIWSSAPAGRAQLALDATESLHERWRNWDGRSAKHDSTKHRLQMYGSRIEMRQALPGLGWAEAFYNGKECVQYDDPGAERPMHWLVHEATHQLASEDAHLTLPRWANEGLACLFSVSRMTPDSRQKLVLRLGSVDPQTYPTWWLPRFKLSGNLATDLKEGKIILPTTILKEPETIGIANSLNQHYLAWWSMAHYFHSSDPAAWKAWILTDGTEEGLLKRFGPRSDLDRRWYAHLLELSDSSRARP